MSEASTKLIEELQDFVPRTESINWKINCAGEQFGLGAFFTEGIPFDIATSKFTASQLVRTIVYLAEQQGSDEILHIYEFGAGLGILAKHVLQLLEKFHTAIYARLVLHISDISESKIADLQATGAFTAFGEHVTFDICDFTSPRYQGDHTPLFVYCSYLLDSLPTRNIRVENGEIFEVLVKTCVPGSLRIIDTENGLPQYLSLDDLRRKLLDDKEEVSAILARRVKPFISEARKLIPLSESTMADDEKAMLTDLVALSQVRSCNLNFSAMAMKATTNILQSLPKGAAFATIDFGTTKLRESAQSGVNLADYGIYHCQQLDFFTLQYCAIKCQMDFHIQDDATGRVTSALISNTHNDERYSYHYHTTYNRAGVDLFKRIDEEVTYMVTEDQLTKFLESTPEFHRSFIFWDSMAHAAAERGAINFALQSAKEAIRYTNGLGLKPRLLIADIYEKLGDLQGAIKEIEALLENVSFSDEIYERLVRLYQATDNKDKLVPLLTDWIKNTKHNVIDRQVLLLAKVLISSGRKEKYEDWILSV